MSLSRKQVRGIRSLLALSALKELDCENNRKLDRKHTCWVNPFLEKRGASSLEANLLGDLMWEDSSDFRNFCRLSVDSFEKLLNMVDSKIQKTNTRMRDAIDSRTRLAITLRYLATGDSYRSLEFLSRLSRKTISAFVPEVLCAIYDALEGDHLQMPSNQQEWLQIADDFEKFWDFPHTLGSIDGKHIRINKPPNSGSDFFNYKGFFSVVLLAVVNAHSHFTYINVGANGRASDSLVFSSSTLYRSIKNGTCHIPPASPLRGQQISTPYFMIGDDIFALDKHLMKGFNRSVTLSTMEEVFNYRLSRARLTVEMAFGGLAARFRIFHRPIEVKLETVDKIVKTCCVLHNYLSKKIVKPLAPDAIIADVCEPFPPTGRSMSAQDCCTYVRAPQIRNNIAKYCMTDGAVEYQWKKISQSSCNV